MASTYLLSQNVTWFAIKVAANSTFECIVMFIRVSNAYFIISVCFRYILFPLLLHLLDNGGRDRVSQEVTFFQTEFQINESVCVNKKKRF